MTPPEDQNAATAEVGKFFGNCWTLRWSGRVCPTCWQPVGAPARIEGEQVLYVAWAHIEGWLRLADGTTMAQCMVEAYDDGCCGDRALIEGDMLMLAKEDAERALAMAEARGMRVRKDDLV